MCEIEKNIWAAMGELQDYFSRLGGDARPRNMTASEIPLFIICRRIQLNDDSFQSQKYTDPSFLKATMPIMENIDSHLQKVSLSKTELVSILSKFYEYAENKLNTLEKNNQWILLGEYLKPMNG